uniref:Uncharacterized protein n=1 Tax=Physcomitrium patens TaxID=3218 RepID=A0A7I4BIE9_PHYPA
MGRKKGMGDKPRVLILAPLNHFAAAFKLANRPMLIDRSSDAHHLLIVEMNDGSAAAAMQAECDRRCRLVELDSSSSSSGAVAFENAQWALSVLRHFHNQERLGEEEIDTNHGGHETVVGHAAKKKSEEPPMAEGSLEALMEESGLSVDDEDTEMDNSGGEKTLHSSPQQISATEGMKEPRDERHKSDLNERNLDSLEGVIKRADSGKAGIHMAQTVGIWLARPQCHALVNLINYCASKSLNRISPFKEIGGDMTSTEFEGKGKSNCSDGNNSVWLHKWLVRDVMQSTSTHRSPLDWLVAHLTASTSSFFLGAVIDDLVDNAMTCNAKNMRSLSVYVRRIGVLEYAALRGPEQVAVEIQRIFSNMSLIGSSEKEGDIKDLQSNDRQRLSEMWSLWLVMATLCPKFLAACSRHWLPCLTVKAIKTCSIPFVDVIDSGGPLSSLWTLLESVTQEEPKKLSAWLSAILSRRICEVAPVGADLVLLLNQLIGLSSTDRLEGGFLEIATSLLQGLYLDLTRHTLPRVIGTEQIIGAEPVTFSTKDEYTGYSLFIDNLKNNLKQLWAELLNACSESFPLSSGRGWWSGDPFVGVCRMTILSSGHYAVAELLAEETLVIPSDREGLEKKSMKRLFFVMEGMKLLAGQGRGAQVLEIWSQICISSFDKSDNVKALQRAFAIKLLLDPNFWESHQFNLMPLHTIERKELKELKDSTGLSWKVVWVLIRKVMDSQWLYLVPLLRRENFWELHLVVLFILQSLSPGKDSRPQAVVVRLKNLLGIFFQRVEEPLDKVEVEKTTELSGEQIGKWQRVQALEHLKRVIVQQASSSFAVFTVMVSSLLDYSFERSERKAETSSLRNNDRRTQRRGVGASGRGFFSNSVLVPGRLHQSSNFALSSSGKEHSSIAPPKFSLLEENRRMKSASLPSLDNGRREKLGSIPRREDAIRPVHKLSKDGADEDTIDGTMLELSDLLGRTVASAVLQAAEEPDDWSPHPAYILASQMKDRLETPHELATTMEQYEEVLPKQVSTPRHIFLIECFGHNLLLFEMLELIVKYRQSEEVLNFVLEFIRALLADSISRWHSAFRTRRDPGFPPPRVFKEERLDRMQVIRLIILVADAGWLPQPLASTIEIIEIIDAADVADLLLLVWRCMHHARASNSNWGGVLDSVPQSVASAEKAQMQGLEGGSAGSEAYTDWEGHLFAILRQNIAQIGAHFAQVYPKRDSL